MLRIATAGLLAAGIAFWSTAAEDKLGKAGPYIGHMVYFKLKDNSPEAKKKFLDSCDALLSGHEGTVFYSAGGVAEAFKGEFNDREWDIALHLVFTDKAAHDKYQVHPDHKKFVADNKDAMEKVRVFDSELDPKKVKSAGGK